MRQEADREGCVDGVEAARVHDRAARGRPVLSWARPPGPYDSNDWNSARRSLPRAVRAELRGPAQFRRSASISGLRRANGNQRAARGCIQHPSGTAWAASAPLRKSEGQKKRRELPLQGSRIQITCSERRKRCLKSTPTRRAAPRPGRRRRSPPPQKIILSGAWPPHPPDARCS